MPKDEHCTTSGMLPNTFIIDYSHTSNSFWPHTPYNGPSDNQPLPDTSISNSIFHRLIKVSERMWFPFFQHWNWKIVKYIHVLLTSFAKWLSYTVHFNRVWYYKYLLAWRWKIIHWQLERNGYSWEFWQLYIEHAWNMACVRQCHIYFPSNKRHTGRFFYCPNATNSLKKQQNLGSRVHSLFIMFAIIPTFPISSPTLLLKGSSLILLVWPWLILSYSL